MRKWREIFFVVARKIFASRTKTKKFSRHLFSVHVTAEKNFSGRNDHFFL
nr:DUF1661 domain-containing protein [Porphyromonas gingivalis]